MTKKKNNRISFIDLFNETKDKLAFMVGSGKRTFPPGYPFCNYEYFGLDDNGKTLSKKEIIQRFKESPAE